MEQQKTIISQKSKLYYTIQVKGGYPSKGLRVNISAPIRREIEKKQGWENLSQHPTIYEEKLDAIVLFRDEVAFVNYAITKPMNREMYKEEDYITKDQLEKFKQALFLEYEDYLKWKEKRNPNAKSKKEVLK